MANHILVGFGFGPIQSGLFVAEAFKSGNFSRIVIAEVDQSLVDAVRDHNGTYYVNVAGADGIVTEQIDGIEIYNPNVESDRAKLIDALAEATEIVTSLPSVKFYDMGENSVAKLISAGLKNTRANGTIIYTAENNNHAAEILSQIVNPTDSNVQFLNTVIGKMSQVATDEQIIKQKKLKTIVPGLNRAFLVEQFNRILVTRTTLTNFQPGIECFLEKDDLLPFEEAKLYGHNAIHALLAFLGLQKGYETMDQLADDQELMTIARNAFINESGGALLQKYAKLDDELFTEKGYKAYAEDLLTRMTCPHLTDSVGRAARDPQRKLGFNDRIFGTIRLALEYGIEPVNMAKGARAGLVTLLSDNDSTPTDLQLPLDSMDPPLLNKLLDWLWQGQQDEYSKKIVKLIHKKS